MKSEVKLRVATLSDAAELLKIYAPYVTDTAITFEYDVPTLEDFKGRIAHTLEKYPYFVAELNGEIVGYAYASAFHPRAAYGWAAETSIYVRRDMKRMGLGRTLYDALETALKAQGVLNLNACIACPDVDDEYLTRNSISFHAHLGYSMVGEFHNCGYKFGRWYNMVWMEKMLGEHVDDQPPVKSFSEVRDELGY